MRRTVLLATVVSALAPAALAQSYIWPEVLLPTSFYSKEFCLPPCACPPFTRAGVLSGTHTLALVSIGDVTDFYEIRDIDWVASLPTGDVRLTGSGTYRISSIIDRHGMSLTLTAEGETEIYNSEFFGPLTLDIPNISIEVMTDIMTCTRITLDIHAVPRCIADTDDGMGFGRPDGGVGIGDLLYYLRVYGESHLRADVDDGTGTGTPDGGIGVEDLLYYLERYGQGC